jgi:hypothetical protein
VGGAADLALVLRLIPGIRVSSVVENAGAVDVRLTADQLARLSSVQAPVGDRYADMSRINR